MAETHLKGRFVGAAFVALLMPFWPLLSCAAEQPLERVRIVYTALSGKSMATWVALEGGFLHKQGLQVELVTVVSGATAVHSLVSGDAQFAEAAGPPVLESGLEGAGNVIIAGLLNTMDYQFIVGKQIKRPDQLQGKTVAVSRLGSSSDFATRYALERFGLSIGKDVTILEVGNESQRFAELTEGKIQGLMLALPLSLKAKQLGFPVLIDMQKLGLEYPHLMLAVMQSTVKSRPDLVRKVLTAYVEAIHYLKTHPKETEAILRKYLKIDNTEELRETYESVGLNLIPEKPYPTLKGIQNVLRELSAKYPKAQTARPEQFVNSTFVKELDSSGFIDRLYKGAPVAPPAARK
jgi:NitT/TauT family transport system substrate-binding protein